MELPHAEDQGQGLLYTCAYFLPVLDSVLDVNATGCVFPSGIKCDKNAPRVRLFPHGHCLCFWSKTCNGSRIELRLGKNFR